MYIKKDKKDYNYHANSGSFKPKQHPWNYKLTKEIDLRVAKTGNRKVGRIIPFKGKTNEEYYGKEKSEEISKKQSLKKAGKLPPKPFEKGHKTWNRNLTKEIDEGVKRGADAKRNRPLSKDHIINLSISHLGLPSGFKGKKFKEESIEKSRKSHTGKTGELASNWQGGLSFEPYSVDWNNTLKRSIRERDKYICKLCNGKGYHVHHIDYNKKNCDPNNLITLCISCHMKTNFNREHWIKLFQNK